MKELDTIREALIKLRAFAKGLDCDYQEECTPDDDDMCQSCRHVYIAEQALAALSTVDPDAGTGWMIEKHNPIPMWWNGCPKREGNGAWSSEPNDGIRFSRKVDAELCAIAQGFSLSKVIITDHRWS